MEFEGLVGLDRARAGREGRISSPNSSPNSPLIVRPLSHAALGASALFEAYAAERPDALALYGRPWNEAGLASAGDAAARAASPARRAAVADVLAEQNQAWGAGADTLALVNRLRDDRSVAVVTGQQLGLFAGPLYTVYKALSAVRAAGHVEAVTGRPAVPVFWLADEDHDFAEVRGAVFTDRARVRFATYDDGLPLDGPRPPVGRIVLDEAALAETFAALERALPDGPHRAEALALARDAYRPGRTMRDAFAVLLRALAPGLVLMSADDARLKRLAAPVLEREAGEWRATARALADQSARLVAAGFHAQIEPSPLGLFWIDDAGLRRPVDPLGDDMGGGVTLRGTSVRWTDAEFHTRVARSPERVSPNVVLRPLVQDTLLPTAVYVAGPGEAAYYAQLTPVYARFGVPMPAIVPRLSLTLVEPAVRKVLDRYDLSVADVGGDVQALWKRLALGASGAGIEAAFADARADAERVADDVERAAGRVDASLDGAAGAFRQAVRHALARMEAKTVRVEKRRHTDILDRVERARAALWPAGALQERALSPLQTVARHGVGALAAAVNAVPLDSSVHHVVDL